MVVVLPIQQSASQTAQNVVIQYISGSAESQKDKDLKLPQGFQRCSCCQVKARKFSGCSCKGGKSHRCQKNWTGVGEPPDIPPSKTQKGKANACEKPKEDSKHQTSGDKDPEAQAQTIKVTVEINVKGQ